MFNHDCIIDTSFPSPLLDMSGIEHELLSLLDSDDPPHTPSDSITVNPDQPSSNKFLICHINAQSLIAHRDDMLNTFSNGLYDMILVTETWLKPSISSRLIELSGYKLVRNDRVHRRGGGVALYARENIPYRIVKQSTPGPGPLLEYIFLEVNLQKQFLVGVLYSPPALGYFQEFDSVLGELMPYYSDFIMMGDLNTCMLHSTNRSKQLSNIFNSYNLTLVNKRPTHHLPNSSTFLDLIVTSSPNKIYTYGQKDAYQFSHHDLIFASLNFKRPKKNQFL